MPDWFPGAGVKKLARVWKYTLDALANKPYDFVHKQRAQGQHNSSYISMHLDQFGSDLTPADEHKIKWTAAIMYGAGTDTVSSPSATSRIKLATQRHFANSSLTDNICSILFLSSNGSVSQCSEKGLGRNPQCCRNEPAPRIS